MRGRRGRGMRGLSKWKKRGVEEWIESGVWLL